MLGVGEEDDELIETLQGLNPCLYLCFLLYKGASPKQLASLPTALRKVSVDVVTFGQYMRPTKRHMKVTKYVTPSQFEEWKVMAESMGFLYVASGPLVRSSFKANELLKSSLGARLLNNRTEQA